MTEVKSQTHLVIRKGTYWFRRRIPQQLIESYGKKEITFSLDTKDPKEAKRRAQVETLRTTQEFESRLALLSREISASLSQEEIDRIALLYYAHLLEENEEVRAEAMQRGGMSDREWANQDYGLAIVADDETHNASRSRLGDTFEEEDFADSLGVKVLPDSPSYVPLMAAMKGKHREALEAMKVRHAGGVVETPKAAPLVIRKATNPAEDSLDALFDYWAAQPAEKGGEKSRTALAEGRTIIRKFREMVGDIPPSQITDEHVVELKDKMLAAGSSPATINKGRGILAAIFSAAYRNKKIRTNPFYGMKKVPVEASEEERPYTIAELRQIFKSPVFTTGARPTQGLGETAYWLPLLGLYTGARVGELGQLFTEDIGEEDGIHFVLIKPESTTGRTTKDKKKRRVPLHPDLIRMGFLDYVGDIRKQGHQQLFPLLKVTREGGKLTDKWRGWWSDYVRKELGITRIPQPFHGLRHSFIEEGRRRELPYEHRMRIEGHALNTVSDKSYGGTLYPLEPLHKAICMLTFKGLDLSHLYKKTED